jgi:putative tricarboxylic transport membrane protein
VSVLTGTGVSSSGAAPVGRRRRPTGRSVFLAVLLVVLAGYTQMAFDMEWRTAAGRIGPGFFPRIVGALALVITLGALVQSVLGRAVDDEDLVGGEEEAGKADLGRHPGTMVFVVAASAGLLLVFTTLGAIVACALFLAVTLLFLNRGRPVLNLAVSVALPIAVYLLFQSLLNAGLPDGVLPRF